MSIVLEIGSLRETYSDIDIAMKDCIELYPAADFSWWNEDKSLSWIDIYTSNTNKTIIGKIIEVT